MNIQVTCSSFLPEKRNLWPSVVQEKHDITFSEYGNIIPSLIKSVDYDITIIILFLKDIIQDNYYLILKNIIDEVEIQASSSSKNICLAFLLVC